MCGIVGLVNHGDETMLEQMNIQLRHRGPDDGGTWSRTQPDGPRVGLGSRRLAILDLSSAGHMPMSTADEQLTIVFNGEIFNYPELRQELERKGCAFRSHTDTEAILHLYRLEGTACVGRLNGMFAIAIWDERSQELFLARDHFGVKPLYYWHQGDRCAFASELKALLIDPAQSRTVDPQALRQFLTFLWVPEPRTMFAGIRKLPAGHFAVLKGGELKIQQYWDLPIPDLTRTSRIDERELACEVHDRFFAAVKRQMLSDVPVGAFLSAGLDSSSIVAAMAQHSASPIRTYTISFPREHTRGEIVDDTDVARRTADAFGCQHTDIRVRPDVANLLPRLIWHMDDPVADPAIITAYLVNREARQSATVLLSGVGGDEVFAGYRKYRAHRLAEQYQRIPGQLRRGVLEPLVNWLPSFRGTPIKGYVRLAKKMARSGSRPPEERFLTDSVYLSSRDLEWLHASDWLGHDDDDVYIQHRRALDNVANANFLHRMMYVDLKTFLPSLNLNYNDKMSMASSVEVRVPFLDWKFVDWAFTHIPPSMNLRHGQTKHLLRRAMSSILPSEVLRQKKAGFGAPIDFWLAHDLRPLTDQLLDETTLRKRGLFRPAAVHLMINEHRSGRSDWSYQLWSLLTLEMWFQAFVDRTADSEVRHG